MPVGYVDGTADYYLDLLAQSAVPTHLHAGLVRYLVDHRRPGSFLMAVIQTDLAMAATRADDECRAKLGDIFSWLHAYAEPDCWGSPANVATWLGSREGVK